MYTSRTDQPYCLCDGPEAVARITVPPRVVTLMEDTIPVTQRGIVGDVTLQFCESDWEFVTELVLDSGMHPFSRYNATRADFSTRENFEALLSNTRDEPDQTEQEDRLPVEVCAVIDDIDDPMIEEHDLAGTYVVIRAMAELGVGRPA